MGSASSRHANRGPHNRLIYDIGDRHLEKWSHLFKGTLYDLGCGDSPYRDYFERYAARYVGVDWENSLHRTRPDLIADLNGPIPVESEMADTVISLSVLEHLAKPNSMIGEAYRILRRGGCFILQVPWQWGMHEAPHDYFRYSPYCLTSLLEAAGFEDIVIEAQGGYFTTAVLKFNYFTHRFIRGPKAIRGLLLFAFWPFWALGQKLAPLLDKLDGNWDVEAPGFFARARKP